MARLTEKQIEILLMVEYGDSTRKQAEVYELFMDKYSGRPIERLVVSKTEKMFRHFGHLRDNY